MLTKAEAKRRVHELTVQSLRRHPAAKLFRGDYSSSEYKKLDKEMEALADFLEKRGKINGSEADAGRESGSEEDEVSSDGEPKARRRKGAGK